MPSLAIIGDVNAASEAVLGGFAFLLVLHFSLNLGSGWFPRQSQRIDKSLLFIVKSELTVDIGARDQDTVYIWTFQVVGVSVGAFVTTVGDIDLNDD